MYPGGRKMESAAKGTPRATRDTWNVAHKVLIDIQ